MPVGPIDGDTMSAEVRFSELKKAEAPERSETAIAALKGSVCSAGAFEEEDFVFVF